MGDQTPEREDTPDEYRGAKLRLKQDEGIVGDRLVFQAINLPRDRTVTVRWTSVQGKWGVQRSNRVLGPQYTRREEVIATKRTDAKQEFTDGWYVPEDYGGSHLLELWLEDEVVLDTAQFTIKPHFELDRLEAPVGDRFRLTAYGLGTDPLTSNYQVTWDNGYVGFITGVVNRGTATADIRAAGPPGKHVVQLWRNDTGVPFVQNYTQSPMRDFWKDHETVWTVNVTEPESTPPLAEMEAMYEEEPDSAHIPAIDEDSDATLVVDPSSGPPGTDAIVTGRGFPPETMVDLVWYTQGGERHTGDPVRPEPRPDVLPSVETDESGSFQVDFTIPYDTGATRPVLAEIDGRSVAASGFMLQPDIVNISPREGPVGTTITVEVAGIGWPLYENTYYVLYDNKPVGYAVSNVTGEDGIVRFELRASGHEGYHCIDMVPSFNETEVESVDLDHKPHLSYLNNNPVRAMPGMHFTFEVTGE